MANVSGVVYAVTQDPPSPSNWLTAGYVNGREKCNLDFYVTLGTEAAGTVIYMGAPLPQGAKVLSVSVSVVAATSGLTVSIGDLNSATRYATNLTGPATANSQTTAHGCIDATNGYYVVGTNPGTGSTALTTGDAQIILTTGGATLGTGNIIGCRVSFTTD